MLFGFSLSRGFAAAGATGLPFAPFTPFGFGLVATAFGAGACGFAFVETEPFSAIFSAAPFFGRIWPFFAARSDFLTPTAYLSLDLDSGSEPMPLTGATRLLLEKRHLAIEVTGGCHASQLFDYFQLLTR